MDGCQAECTSPSQWRRGVRGGAIDPAPPTNKFAKRPNSKFNLWGPAALAFQLLVCLTLAAVGFTALAPSAHAVEPDEILADAALESRARRISTDLRCLVCQNQSIDDSNAPLARDLRLLVRERLKHGDDDAAVRAFIVQRYGEFVLLRPPFSARTLILWLAPLLLLGAALAVLLRRRRARTNPAAPAPLTSDEQARLEKILKSDQ